MKRLELGQRVTVNACGEYEPGVPGDDRRTHVIAYPDDCEAA